MNKESKLIKKTDESALFLLHEALGEEVVNVTNIDSYYRINDTYIFLEFIKFNNSLESHNLNSDWPVLKNDMLNIWDFVKSASGVLWIVFYSENKSEFRLFKIHDATHNGVVYNEELYFNYNEFKQWFQRINAEVLKG